MTNLLERITQLFQPKRLSSEAFRAYFYRLPDRVQVSWWRDGNYIVGRVSDGKNEFLTQGRDPENFIEMVNDALITVYDIPREYIDAIKNVKTFAPNKDERQRLNDPSVSSSSFSYKKDEAVLQAA